MNATVPQVRRLITALRRRPAEAAELDASIAVSLKELGYGR